MWETIYNKNTVQDGHGKQHNHNRNAKALEKTGVHAARQ